MDQKKTGYFLKQLRNEKKLTQEQLAEKIGVSIETISSIERGIKMPRLQAICPISACCWNLQIFMKLISGKSLMEKGKASR